MTTDTDQSRIDVLDGIVIGRDSNTMLIWRWADAPENLKPLSEDGGDEEGMAWIPKTLMNGNDPPHMIQAVWNEFGPPTMIHGTLVIWAHA